MGAAIVNDLDVAHAANTFEEFLQVLFGHVVRQVADIDPRGFHGRPIATSRTFAAAAFPLRGFSGGSLGGGTLVGAGVAGVGFGRARLSLWLGALRFAFATGGWRGGLVEADCLEQLLPPTQLGRSRTRGTRALRPEFFGAVRVAVLAGIAVATAAVVLLIITVSAAAGTATLAVSRLAGMLCCV